MTFFRHRSALFFTALCAIATTTMAQTPATLPDTITIKNIAQNPEGIEYDPVDQTFLLSSLNASPVLKIHADGTFKAFTHGDAFPLSTAGLQIDARRNRLLVAAFNGTALMDDDPATKGMSHLRMYHLQSGKLEADINLSSLAPKAGAYFANDIAVDTAGNVYISDWYAQLIYKVDINGKASIFWRNQTQIPSGPNGLDFHPGGYLLVSMLSVNDKGLYDNYALVKIPTDQPNAASLVKVTNAGYTGFDGLVIDQQGNAVGVTNDGKNPGGNTLAMLSSNDYWQSAAVVSATPMVKSTTLAMTPEQQHYVIHQDFTNPTATTWTIEKISLQ